MMEIILSTFVDSISAHPATTTFFASASVFFVASAFIHHRHQHDALAHIPGPQPTVSNAIGFLQSLLSGKFHEGITRLHDKYGSVVRIGPSIVIFRDIRAMRTIYASNKFKKAWIYDSFHGGGVEENVFSTRDIDFHRKRVRFHLCLSRN